MKQLCYYAEEIEENEKGMSVGARKLKKPPQTKHPQTNKLQKINKKAKTPVERV